MIPEQSSLTSYDDPQESAVGFRCPICEFTDEKEWIVRSHINRSTDNPHHHREGFMPEDEIDVLDTDGNVIDSKQGNPRRRFETLQNLSADDFPERFTETDQQIVKIAVQNLTENYTDLTKRVNDQRTEAGLEPLDYSKVYRTVVDELGLERKPKERGKSSEEKTYADLTQRQRAVINAYVRNPSQSHYQIAQEANVHESYPPQILDKYAHIAESIAPEDIVPVTDFDATDFDFDPTQPTNEPMNQQILEATEDEYNQLTGLQQAVLDKLVENPNKSNAIIANETHADPMFVERVENEFDTLIRVRRGEVPLSELKAEEEEEDTAHAVESETTTTTESPEQTADTTEESDMTQKSEIITKEDSSTSAAIIDLREHNAPEGLISEFEARTPKQQAVLTQLAQESNPADPDTPAKTIGENAGVHGTYVTQVMDKYGHIATAIHDFMSGETISEDFTPDDTATTEASEDTAFADEFAAAVEAGEVSRINVREILDNINNVDDPDLLKRALELDERKTSSSAYKNRIEDLVDNTKELSWVDTDESEPTPEPEPEPAQQTVEEPTANEADEDTSSSMTDQPAEPIQSSSITLADIQRIDETAKQFIRTAESEIENSDNTAPAARAKSVAEEFERIAQDLLARTNNESTQNQPQSAD